MVERDYAAPLSQERRELIWNKFNSGRRLSGMIDWDFAPPSTPALRERFPHLLDSQPTSDGIPPGPSIPAATRLNYHATKPSGQLHSRTASAQGDTWHGHGAQDAQTIPQDGRPPPYFESYRSNRSTRSHFASHQQTQRRPRTEQVPATVHMPPVRSHIPPWFTGSFEGSWPAPASAPSAHPSPPQSYRQHDTGNTIYRRDSQGRLLDISETSRLSSREQTIRRRPAVQSSLRNQVSREHSDRVRHGSIYHVITGVSTSVHHSVATGHRRNSYNPFFTQSQASVSLQTPGSRIQSPSHVTIANLQASGSSPTSTSFSLLELQELEGSLQYNPPDFPHVPLPTLPFVQQHCEGSSLSIATFENPNSSFPPLSRFQAQLAGLKQALQSPQSLKTKAIKLAKRVKPKCKELWTSRVEWKAKIRAKIDVAAFGPQFECMCSVCVKKRGMDPMRATEVAHYVPDATRPFAEVMPHESGYGRLAFWEF